MNKSDHQPDTVVSVGCINGEFYEGTLVEMPFYDKAC